MMESYNLLHQKIATNVFEAWNVASVTEELNLYFYFIWINLRLK